ncbi:recombinase RecT [Spiroplasma endosymbiont of Virgichneumon dumeticola]
MTKQECEEHRKKYSKANGNSPWTTSFNAMALKTVIKAIIRDINKDPSIKLENQNIVDRAMQIDQAIVLDNENIMYVDNPNNDNKEIKLKEIEETKEEININYEQIQNNIDNLDKLEFSNE